METPNHEKMVIRYRGFLLLKQPNHSWLVRPERSPMIILPFRTTTCTLSVVKAIIDKRLRTNTTLDQAA